MVVIVDTCIIKSGDLGTWWDCKSVSVLKSIGMAYKHHKQYILLAITAMPIEHAHYKYVVQDHLFSAHVHNWPSMCKQKLSTIYRHAQGKLYRDPIQHAFGSLINYTLQNLKQ